MNSSINMSQGIVDLSREELAFNFCNNLYSYLLTILIFVLFYIMYRQELKQYVYMFFNWIAKDIKDFKTKKYLLNIPEDIEWALGYFSIFGVGIILWFYSDYMSLTQTIILFIFVGILVLHRLIELISWISKKLIGFYIKNKMGKVTKEMEDLFKEDEKLAEKYEDEFEKDGSKD